MFLAELVAYLDDLLRTNEIHDAAHNGLQVEGKQQVRRVGLAVDSSLAGFQQAVEQQVDLLLVHHGLFWEGPRFHPLTGLMGSRVKTLLSADISLYGAHLPLDVHPVYGNNAVLARLLGLQVGEFFAPYGSVLLALHARCAQPIPLQTFVNQVEDLLKVKTITWQFGPEMIYSVGIASGKATPVMPDVVTIGADTFLTGETAHGGYHTARELGLNVIHAGHYATEAVGVKALGQHLAEKFNLETVFIDEPTGL